MITLILAGVVGSILGVGAKNLYDSNSKTVPWYEKPTALCRACGRRRSDHYKEKEYSDPKHGAPWRCDWSYGSSYTFTLMSLEEQSEVETGICTPMEIVQRYTRKKR